eukprot:904365_1
MRVQMSTIFHCFFFKQTDTVLIIMEYFDNLRNAVVIEHQTLLQQLEAQYEQYIINLLRRKAEIHTQLQHSFYQKLAEIDQMIIHAANNMASSVQQWPVHPQTRVTCPSASTQSRIKSNTNNHTNTDQISIPIKLPNIAANPVVIDIVSSPDMPDADNQSSFAKFQRDNVVNEETKCRGTPEHIKSHSTQELQLFIDSHRDVYDEIVLTESSGSASGYDSNNISIILITPSPPPPDILLTHQRSGIVASDAINDPSPFLKHPNEAPLIDTVLDISKEENCSQSPIHNDNTTNINSKTDNHKAELLKTEGNKLMKKHKYKAAVAQYSKAIDLDPNNAIYFSNRASAQTKLGNYTQAILDSRKASKIDPYYIKAYLREGLAYYETSEYQKAIDVYSKGLEHIKSNSKFSSKCCSQIHNKIALCRLKMDEAKKEQINRNKIKRYEPQCRFCPYTATTKDDVQRHELIHYPVGIQQIDPKPFKCRICDEPFMQKQNLKKHMTTHSASHNYECKQCRKPFKTKTGLQKHTQTAHLKKKSMRKSTGYYLPQRMTKQRTVRAISNDLKIYDPKRAPRTADRPRYQYIYSPPQICNTTKC